MQSTTGRIDLTFTALDSIHHGGTTAGNTQLLRTQDIVLPDGTEARIPFISGNSFRHKIRAAGVRHAIEVMGVSGGLSKPVVDLLFSGGSLSKGGNAVRLDVARRIAQLFPMLSLMGYAAGNTMMRSKVRVDNIHLVCVENSWRLPATVDHLMLASRRAGLFRGEDFGTNMEPTNQPDVVGLLGAVAEAELVEAISDDKSKAERQTTQMIYDYEVIKPGAVLFGAIHLDAVNPSELAALRCAMTYACEGTAADGRLLYRLGGKGSRGYGRVAVEMTGALRCVTAAAEVSHEALLPRGTDRPGGDEQTLGYEAHLRDNRAAIIDMLSEVSK